MNWKDKVDPDSELEKKTQDMDFELMLIFIRALERMRKVEVEIRGMLLLT